MPLPGGKGIHVAQVATALGAEAIATGILGGHHGRWLAETLAGEGVPGVFAWAAAGETRSCLTVADRATGGLTEFYEDGIRATAEDWAGLARHRRRAARPGPELAGHGGLGAGGAAAWRATRSSSGRRARRACAARWTPAAPDLARAIEERPDLVKINAAEACELLEIAPHRWHRARARGGRRGPQQRPAATATPSSITLGEQGMVLVDPDGAAWHGAVAAHGDYPVGSGDAFLAGLLTALTADPAAGWPEAARLGLGAAAANAEVPGAARLDPARARELAAAAELRRL